MTSQEPKIELIIRFANGGRLMPEDIALIDAIRASRSIIGAGRATGISYRKCWLMADALNRTFESPVFGTYPGRKEAGSEVTPFGERLVALYRSIERRAAGASTAALAELESALNPAFRPRAHTEKVEAGFSRTARSTL